MHRLVLQQNFLNRSLDIRVSLLLCDCYWNFKFIFEDSHHCRCTLNVVVTAWMMEHSYCMQKTTPERWKAELSACFAEDLTFSHKKHVRKICNCNCKIRLMDTLMANEIKYVHTIEERSENRLYGNMTYLLNICVIRLAVSGEGKGFCYCLCWIC